MDRSQLGSARSRVRHRIGLGLVLAGVAITPVWIAALLWFGLRLVARALP